MSECNHDLVECETAVFCDGICPICQAATIDRLRVELNAQQEGVDKMREDNDILQARIAALEGALKKQRGWLVASDKDCDDWETDDAVDAIDQALAEGGE